MGETSLPYIWATVVIFNKTEKSRLFFDLIGRIQRNYRYYKRLYNIREGNYRNDYAFAIADNILNGYTPSLGIPWTMLTIENTIESIEVQGSKLIVRAQESAHVIPKQCLHVIDKDYLQSEQYIELVNQICATS